ncbi:MAG: UbiX family flavin prenyltransferase [Desulfohalobiaceae bacterium]
MFRYILALTGASGMPYARVLLEAMSQRKNLELHLIISNAARQVLELEVAVSIDSLQRRASAVYSQEQIGAPLASGSWQHQGMVVCPCSMASLAAISQGLGSNLIHRAADVTLKEGRPLILVPRETPLNRIHLQNMLQASQAGAVIMPACPGFYHQPSNIEDLLLHMAGRILDQLGVENNLFSRWEGGST